MHYCYLEVAERLCVNKELAEFVREEALEGDLFNSDKSLACAERSGENEVNRAADSGSGGHLNGTEVVTCYDLMVDGACVGFLRKLRTDDAGRLNKDNALVLRSVRKAAFKDLFE